MAHRFVLALFMVAACGSESSSPDGGADAAAIPPGADAAAIPPGADAAAIPPDAPSPDGPLTEGGAGDALDALDTVRAAVPCGSPPIPPFCIQHNPFVHPCQLPITGSVVCMNGSWQCPPGSTNAVEGCQVPDGGS